MKFSENEIIDYLNSMEDKPYNISIRNYYSEEKVTFPMIAVSLGSQNSKLVLKNKEKINYINFIFEIYATNKNGKSGIDIINEIEEWLTEKILKRFGLIKRQSSAPMMSDSDYSKLRKVINFDGILTDDGYIYQN